MTSLHTKQQNVLRRKMEEAVASNKRLRDVLEKQKAAKKTSKDGDVKGGLAGAAERMRNFVTQVNIGTWKFKNGVFKGVKTLHCWTVHPWMVHHFTLFIAIF